MELTLAIVSEYGKYPARSLECPPLSRHGKSSVESVFSDDLKPDDREQSGRAADSLRKQIISMSTKLFVGNLSFNTTENDLQDAFAPHGTVVSVDLIMDKMSGRSRGFAFVTMESKEAADAATKALNGAELDGRALTVNEARPREERPGGRSGGFGGGGSRGPRREYGSNRGGRY